MNCYGKVIEYIDKCEVNEPIFIDEIKEYIKNYYKKDELKKVYNNIKAILNRLVNMEKIRVAYKGIYYLPKKNVFGEVGLPVRKIVNYKYLIDKNNDVKGYITGAKLFNDVGLTTQVPNIIDIATNECKNKNKYTNNYFNTTIRKPKIKVTNDNYKYLQLLDLIDNPDNITIEVDNAEELIYNFIIDNNLQFEKILKYAVETKNKNMLNKIALLAR